jgi:hypothetical protein
VQLIVLVLTLKVQRRTVREGVFLGHPTRTVRGPGLEARTLLLVIGEGAYGEFVLFSGGLSFSTGRLRHFGYVPADLGKLFSKGPIPAASGDLFP